MNTTTTSRFDQRHLANHKSAALPAGTVAPDFTLRSTPDQFVSLSDFRGQPVVLAFYPADWSPVCGDQMTLYNEILPEFKELGAELLGISAAKVTLPVAGRDHIQGPVDAPIALLEYGDFECSVCGEVYPVIKEIRRRLGDNLCFAFRHFPMTNVHPHAQRAAEAAEAAGAQGSFWEMHDILFENQDALEDEDLARYAVALGLDARRLMTEVLGGAHTRRVREDFRSGVRGGVNGTPTFFINGERYDGARGLDPLLAALTQPDRKSTRLNSSHGYISYAVFCLKKKKKKK